MLWSNWKERNSFVHGVPTKPHVVCYGNCVSIWKCLLEVQASDLPRQRHRLNVVQGDLSRWSPPYPGYIKINCDGAVSSDRAHVGAGCVVRNVNGDLLGAIGLRITQRLEPYVCELFAIKLGLEFAVEHGWGPLEVETDCLEVVQMVNGAEECFHVVGVVVEEARKLMYQLQVSEITYTPREANMTAHAVASFVARNSERLCWLGNGASWLVQVIECDKPVTEVLSREVHHGSVHDRAFQHM